MAAETLEGNELRESSRLGVIPDHQLILGDLVEADMSRWDYQLSTGGSETPQEEAQSLS